jgi:hypothetical protein
MEMVGPWKGPLFSMLGRIGLCVCRPEEFFFQANGIAGFDGFVS